MTDGPIPFSADPLPAGSRIACRIEYDGSSFNGWQVQPDPGVRTVQGVLERGFAEVACSPLRVHCAGRTDTGVHASAQVIHFDSPAARSGKAWVLGVNANLPSDVRVHWAVPVPGDFHARFSALSRRYRYVIANNPVRPALLGGQITWQRRPLDTQLMNEEAQCLLGEQDFSAFRAAACQSSTSMRNVHAISVSRRGDLVIIDIKANAFLHHMVRNIAGSLIAVGIGRQQTGWIRELMLGRDRTVAAETAPADGLYLVEVEYPSSYQLPAVPDGPMLAADYPPVSAG